MLNSEMIVIIFLLLYLNWSRGYPFPGKVQTPLGNRQCTTSTSRPTWIQCRALSDIESTRERSKDVHKTEEERDELEEKLISLCDEVWGSALNIDDFDVCMTKRTELQLLIDNLSTCFTQRPLPEQRQQNSSFSSSSSSSSPWPSDLLQSTVQSSLPFSPPGAFNTSPYPSLSASTAFSVTSSDFAQDPLVGGHYVLSIIPSFICLYF